jgi:hypothetical protein
VSGNNQTNSTGGYADLPLVVSVVNSSGGAPLTNAPVTFTVISGAGQVVSGLPGSSPAGSAVTAANSSGTAQMYFQQPGMTNVASTVTATTGGRAVTFHEATQTGDGTFDAPTGLLVVYGGNNQLNLSWSNHASAASGILIEQSSDSGSTWTTVTTLSDPTADSYAVTGLNPNFVYCFRVGPQP